jgi:membrane protein
VSVKAHAIGTVRFLVHLYGQWDTCNVPKMSASLTYYVIVALAPLVAVLLAFIGFAFGSGVARDRLVETIRFQIGDTGALVVQALIEGVSNRRAGALATTLGLIALFFGATGVFIDLKNSLAVLWDIPDKSVTGLGNILRARLLSFGMVLITGLLMVFSICLSVSLSAIQRYFGDWIPLTGGRDADIIISFAVTTMLFAIIYRVVPPERMPWRHIAFGATTTAMLFTAGKAAISTYIGTVGVGSFYGAAGSLFAFLIWLYYSSQVFFIGAIITRSGARASRIGEARRKERARVGSQFPS